MTHNTLTAAAGSGSAAAAPRLQSGGQCPFDPVSLRPPGLFAKPSGLGITVGEKPPPLLRAKMPVKPDSSTGNPLRRPRSSRDVAESKSDHTLSQNDPN